jgi:hypothetical protein
MRRGQEFGKDRLFRIDEPGLGAGTRLFRFGAGSDALRGVLLFSGHLKLLNSSRFDDRRRVLLNSAAPSVARTGDQ